ncbi:Hpt domain-containing protein [Glaciimonas sp. PAMC28666]|uniref:Hpt domain-containing protein n=1 Tax=Glaciimonas sp. PAMC28666 TaxID=2807626 RepID=UPI001965FF44|nr:Hpt domain-containing protein [Glaciimonas sp. PAMC28666]QRX83623.1 Hpt domain-containing protein [Glaciimonas sp. PAMC28666]
MNGPNGPIDNEDPELARLMISLGKEYADILPARFAQMHAALDRFKEHSEKKDANGDATKQAEAISTLFHLMHSLSGSAGSFGFTALGKLASQLEQKMQLQITENIWSEKTFIDIKDGISELEKRQPNFASSKTNPNVG